MKYIVSTVILLSVIGGLGLAIYTIVFKSEPVVMSSETEGIEAIRPRNMRITENDGTSFVVEWETTTDVSGYVKYGDTSTTLGLIAQDVNGTNVSKNHRVRINDLEPGKKYYFWVMSDDVAFGRDGRTLEVLMVNSETEI